MNMNQKIKELKTELKTLREHYNSGLISEDIYMLKLEQHEQKLRDVITSKPTTTSELIPSLKFLFN